MKHCRVGETVRVIGDFAVLHELQSAYGIWNDDMVLVSGLRISRIFVPSNWLHLDYSITARYRDMLVCLRWILKINLKLLVEFKVCFFISLHIILSSWVKLVVWWS